MFFIFSFLLISLPYPFDDPALGPQTSATVYGCTDCARDKGTARKSETSYIVYIIDLYILYNYLKDCVKVSCSKQISTLLNLSESWK